MTDREQIAAEVRAANPELIRQRSRRGGHGEPPRVHEQIILTPVTTAEEYEARVQEEVEATLAQRQQGADATRERELLLQLLADVEDGTAGEALAALRVLVPRLARRELREAE